MNTQPAQPQLPDIELRDIHLPDSVSWWPPATGYWLVLALILIIFLLLWFAKKRHRQTAVKRAALSEFNNLKTQFQQHQDAQLLITQLSALLRRAAISSYPRSDCASLTGEQWLHWLDTGLKNSAIKFSAPAGQLLLTAPYQKTVSAQQSNELLSLCQQWLSALPAAASEHGDQP
jgi:hypothetical protein